MLGRVNNYYDYDYEDKIDLTNVLIVCIDVILLHHAAFKWLLLMGDDWWWQLRKFYQGSL